MAIARRKTHDERLRERASLALRMERDSLVNFAVATALAAPLSLLATDGSLFVVGAVWAVAYAGVMLLPTALFVVMAFDALRIGLRRHAVFMPYLWAIGKAALEDESPRRDTPLASLLALGIVGNPLNTLVRELWLFGLRFNRAAAAQIDADAECLSRHMRSAGVAGQLIAREVRSVSGREHSDLVVAC